MKRISIILASLVLILGLSSSALATPCPGTYSTLNGTLYPGFWYEDFSATGGQMGVGNSHLTAQSDEINPAGTQWTLDMISQPAGLYSGGAPYVPPSGATKWNYTTPYSGTIRIGGNLTTGDFVPFATNATNYNVAYNTTTGALEWVFVSHGTYDGYLMDVVAYYIGYPAPISFTPDGKLAKFGDLVDNIQMTMTITGPAPVPEPATMMLLGSGLVGLWGFRKKFRK